jgi:hypothetical protein
MIHLKVKPHHSKFIHFGHFVIIGLVISSPFYLSTTWLIILLSLWILQFVVFGKCILTIYEYGSRSNHKLCDIPYALGFRLTRNQYSIYTILIAFVLVTTHLIYESFK